MVRLKFATGAFLLMALTFANRGQSESEATIGSCLHSDMKREKFQCRTNFFVELKNDPSDCRTKYEDLRNCSKQIVVNCLKDTALAAMVNFFLANIVQAMGAEDIYCQQGGIALSLVSSDVSTDACRDRLMENLTPCSEEYHRMFSDNPADSRLCRKYNETMECAISQIDSACSAEEAARIDYLHENPVCEADRLLAEAPSTATPIKHGVVSTESAGAKPQLETPKTKPTAKETGIKTNRPKELPSPAVKESSRSSAIKFNLSTFLYATVFLICLF